MSFIFSERLKLARKVKGLTQSAIAKKLGITLRSYQRYEENTRFPDLDIILKMSKVFGLPIQEFFGGEVEIEDDNIDITTVIYMLGDLRAQLEKSAKCFGVSLNVFITYTLFSAVHYSNVFKNELDKPF